jgi:hypothetical protein
MPEAICLTIYFPLICVCAGMGWFVASLAVVGAWQGGPSTKSCKWGGPPGDCKGWCNQCTCFVTFGLISQSV